MRVWRGAIALAALAGIVTLLVDTGGDPDSFAYFTVQSNALVAVVFGVAAAVRPIPPWLRGATALYISITGTVYHLVLVNPASPFFTPDPGAHTLHNLLLHSVTPVLAAVDWLFVGRERVRWWYAAAWLAYPLAYLGFALIRGLIVHSYPYPFVDVGELGYGGVGIMALILSGTFFVLGLILIGLRAIRLAATDQHTRVEDPAGV